MQPTSVRVPGVTVHDELLVDVRGACRRLTPKLSGLTGDTAAKLGPSMPQGPLHSGGIQYGHALVRCVVVLCIVVVAEAAVIMMLMTVAAIVVVVVLVIVLVILGSVAHCRRCFCCWCCCCCHRVACAGRLIGKALKLNKSVSAVLRVAVRQCTSMSHFAHDFV